MWQRSEKVAFLPTNQCLFWVDMSLLLHPEAALRAGSCRTTQSSGCSAAQDRAFNGWCGPLLPLRCRIVNDSDQPAAGRSGCTAAVRSCLYGAINLFSSSPAAGRQWARLPGVVSPTPACGARPLATHPAPACGLCQHQYVDVGMNHARFSVQFPHPGRQGLGCINRCHTQIRGSSSHCSAICDFSSQIRSKACLVREPHAWRAAHAVSVVQRMNSGVWLGLMSHCGS